MSPTVLLLSAVLAFLAPTLSFHLQSPHLQRSMTTQLRAFNEPQQRNSEFPSPKKALAASLASLTVFGAPVVLPYTNLAFIPSAVADVRAQQKRTYFRYVPKLTEGIDYYDDAVKKAIEKEDWAVVEKLFEVYVTKYNPNDPSQVDSTDSYVNNHFYRPMTILAGSFAERGSSPKQRALIEQKDAFEVAMGNLEGCVKTRKGSGLFAPDIKPPTGAAKKKQGLDALADGRKALSEYIKIFNAGLMKELNVIKEL